MLFNKFKNKQIEFVLQKFSVKGKKDIFKLEIFFFFFLFVTGKGGIILSY